MREGWERVTLGDVFSVSGERLGEHTQEPTVFSISKYDGVVPAAEYFDKRVASANLAGYKVLRRGMWAYSTIHIDEGSIAYNKTGMNGVVSPMYTLFNWNSEVHIPEYFELLLRSDEMLATYADNAQGSIDRRRSLLWKTFSMLHVNVPPLAEQRRIVELIGALDEAIEAADGAIEEQIGALDSFLDVFTHLEMVPIGQVASTKSGASWAAADSAAAPADGYRPVLTIVNTRPGGTIDLSERTYVKGLARSAATLTGSSLVMIRTNGNRSRIGNVYRPGPANVGDSVSAFQFVIEPNSAQDRDYIYWMLRTPSRQAAISSAASGSTGLGNIAAIRVKAMDIPWPDSAERAWLTELCEAFGEAVDAAKQAAAAIRFLRTELLSALLSGDHEIPSSYDRFLEGISA